MLAAKEYQESKEAAEQEEKRWKALEKEEVTHRHVQAVAEKLEAALQREMRWETAREGKGVGKVRKL